MTCGGCSGAIDRVLKKNIQARESCSRARSANCLYRADEGYIVANAYTVSLKQQQVLVWGPELPTFEEVTEKIAKTGKTINDKKVIEKVEDIPVVEA